MSWNAKTLHVSPTGRANPTGKSYRKPGQRVRYAKRRSAKHAPDRPLGLELQCHPQALTRTPLHPGCTLVYTPQYGIALCDVELADMEMDDFLLGVGLWAETEGYWRVVCSLTKQTLGYAECHDALAYRIAAERKGVTLEVYDE